MEQIPEDRHPPLSHALRGAVDHEGRHGGDHPAHPARRTSRPWCSFHETLSERSVYLRYFHLMNLEQRTTHERLTRICFIDYDREMALVAERRNPETGETRDPGRGPPDEGPRHATKPKWPCW